MRAGFWTRALTLGLTAGLLGSAFAADIYVDNTNAAAGDGTSGNPYQSLETALANASAGDRVLVAYSATPYTSTASAGTRQIPTATLGTPFTIADNNLTLEGVAGGGGEKPILLNGDNNRHTILVNGTGVTIKGFEIRLAMDTDYLPAGNDAATPNSDRAGIFADNTSSRVFDNLTIQNNKFVLVANGASSWRHLAVRAIDGGGVKETVNLIGNTVVGNPYSGSYASPGFRNVYKGEKAYFAKAFHTTGVKVSMTGNDTIAFFRDLHIETPTDLTMQSNIIRNSVEINSPSNGGIPTGTEMRFIDNRFLGEYAYEHRYLGVTTNVGATPVNGTDEPGYVGFDGDYAGLFNPSTTGYAGALPQMISGYQDELLFIKGNVNASAGVTPRITIERNYFVTRRKGINIARSTNVLIKRNLFVTEDAAYPELLPPPGAANVFGIVRPDKQHISIDPNYIQTCCYGTDLPSLEVEIVANDFEGTGAIGVYFANEIPKAGQPGGGATTDPGGNPSIILDPGTFTDGVVIAGNDFNPDVVAVENNYTDPSVQRELELDDNFFGQPGGPTPGQLEDNSGGANITNNTSNNTTQVNDTDGDGLYDGEETSLYNTLPNDPDSDGDGLSDGVEVALARFDPTNYDPNDALKPATTPPDADGDGIPDAQDPDDASFDGNGDRIRDSYAYAATYNAYGPVTLGDVNRDGARDNVDAVRMIEVFLGLRTLTGTSNDYDINRDGKVDNVDAIILFNWSVGNIPYIPFP